MHGVNKRTTECYVYVGSMILMALVLGGLLVGVGTKQSLVDGSLGLISTNKGTVEDGVNKLLKQDFWAASGEAFKVESAGLTWESADGYFLSGQDNLNVGCMISLPNGVTITKVTVHGDIGVNEWKLYRYPVNGVGAGDVMATTAGVGSTTTILYPVVDTSTYAYSVGASIDDTEAFTGIVVEYKI